MTDLKKLKIALVGGAGFIGHNLALNLTKHGSKVSIIDSLEINNLHSDPPVGSHNQNQKLYSKVLNERFKLLKESDVSLVIQDAREYHELTRALTKIGPDVVIVLAAVAHAGKSNKDPHSTFDHSFRTLENTLDSIRDSGAHLIYFSSSMVYGNFGSNEVTEETTCNPLGIYGALKYGGEKLVIAYNQVFNLPYTIIRPSALYGERCVSGRIGQVFIESGLKGEKLKIQGDGSQCLDFTYIQDLIQGVRKVITNENSRNEIFNITYGEGRSINNLLEIMKNNFDDIEYEYSDWDALTPERGTLSVIKARELIGYAPEYDLVKGFKKYIEWYHSIYRNNDGYKFTPPLQS